MGVKVLKWLNKSVIHSNDDLDVIWSGNMWLLLHLILSHI